MNIKKDILLLMKEQGYNVEVDDSTKELICTEELDNKIKLYIIENYIELRRQAYPTVIEQLDIMFHLGFDAWKKVIDDIKTKYPKE